MQIGVMVYEGCDGALDRDYSAKSDDYRSELTHKHDVAIALDLFWQRPVP